MEYWTVVEKTQLQLDEELEKEARMYEWGAWLYAKEKREQNTQT
jgi:hypothetical protein